MSEKCSYEQLLETRAKNKLTAVALKDEGKTYKEISELLGVAFSTVRKYVNGPTPKTQESREKARVDGRKRYAANREKLIEQTRNWRDANLDKIRKYSKQYSIDNKQKIKSAALLRKYGITLKQYNDMLEIQSGKCSVCGELFSDKEQKLVVDHCHKTGRVRGLLCSRCNVALGFARDCPHVLRSLADYIEHHKDEQIRELEARIRYLESQDQPILVDTNHPDLEKQIMFKFPEAPLR